MGPTEDAVRNNAKGGCKDLPAEITMLFEGFKPYKGGNNALRALNEIAGLQGIEWVILRDRSGGSGCG
jgi:hypothetical protein